MRSLQIKHNRALEFEYVSWVVDESGTEDIEYEESHRYYQIIGEC